MDRKKSNFPALTSLPSDATIDFVSGGANYKIALSDYLSALSVTGSIVQAGSPVGTPVLDTQSSVNNIRNLENGPGVKASISAQNGVTIEHNFGIDTAGVQLLSNPSLLSPTMRSVVAGTGIAVSSVDDTIVITSSTVAASTKTVLINQLSDFPDALSSVITLLADTNYLLANDIDLGTNRLVMNDNTSLLGTGLLTITLSYSGTGDCISWVNANIGISNLRLYAPSGRVWNGSNAGEIVRLQNLSITECDKIGQFTSTSGTAIRLTFVACTLANTDGIAFSGSFGAFGHNTGLMTVNSGSMYGLGTATFAFFASETIVAVIGAGAVGLSGMASSGNILTGGAGRVLSGVITGAGAPVSGISIDDTGWLFFHNNNFPDTRTDALLSMQGNATATTISASSTDGSNAVLVAGTWVVEMSSRMTGTTVGRVTFDLYEGGKIPMTASVSVEPSSGSNIALSAYIALNGSIVAGSKRSASASSGSPASITLPWQFDFNLSDYVEIFVENNDGSANILVSSAVLRMN